MTDNQANALTNLEELIIMALYANSEDSRVTRGAMRTRDDTGGVRIDVIDQGTLLPFSSMTPHAAYTCDATDSDRLFATTADYLNEHPKDILQNESEAIMLSERGLKWIGMRRIKSAPKRVSVLGKADVWYEMHCRFTTLAGADDYVRRVVPFDRNGKPLLAKLNGHIVCSPAIEGVSATLVASIIEDAHRTNAMLAEIRDNISLKFPVPLDDYKEVFSERDGPLKNGRKKAIVHWVAKHLRHTAKGEATVRKHVRGVRDIVVDGININITPNA